MNIIEKHFSKNNIFQIINSNECIVLSSSKKLGELSQNNKINNWSKNRPRDDKKIKEIVDSINNNTYATGILYLFVNKKKKIFVL